MPASVLAAYQSVNANAEKVAQTPFQQYSGTGTPTSSGYTSANAGSFVAPVNATQQSGISNTNAAANEAQPYFGAATSGLGAAQAGVNPINQAAEAGTAQSSAPLTGQQIDSYLSPYLHDVMGSTSQLLGQQNEQAQAGQLGDAIRSGAFGGDRTGIAAANLNQQNQLASANILSGIANQGYQSALGTAQGQQQIGLAGAQQLAGIGQTAYGEGANTSSQLAGLGAGAQTAGLQGAQAQIGAGTVQQQTQQAQDTAQYQQFLQQQSYPFQTAQFLANIAEGTGALSGSTTTTTQPGGFFSDERLKEDMEPIGKTFDGQPIYRYKMKGDPREQIGLSAQKVERKHPEAVGLAGGFKYVDYGRATEEAANRAHFYEGGVVPFRRQRFADGGDTGGGLDAVLSAQQRMYAPQGGGGQRNIPSQGATHQLAVAQGTPAPPASGSSKVSTVEGLGKDAYQGYKYFNKPTPTAPAGTPSASAGLAPASQPTGATAYGAGAPAEAYAAPVPADSAGLGMAETGAVDTSAMGATGAGTAAADAAGAGAVDAAAGAGAGAAAGAAGGAAAAGATDAAAALAAEYALADAAMVAAVAAKRGGRIGLAAGGDVDPYSSPDDGLAIPDQEVSNEHLQSPGPLVKRPTGLQTAMKMGDPNQWSSMAGGMFSNTALARGGLAGRRGYDDGGTPDDPPDAASATISPAPAVNDAPSSSTGVASPKGAHWWQKSENILPILSGLAAMGTANTVHPGVALAAGLGAGAQSYLNTRSSQAKTAEEQQKAKGADIANQLASLKLGVAKDAFAPTSGAVIPRQVAPLTQQMPSTAAPSGDAQQTSDGLAAQYRHQFFVNTARTPEEQAAKDAALKQDWAVGGSMFSSQADNDYQARVERDKQNSRNTAQQMADARYAQYTDPNSSPTDKKIALAHYNPLRQWTGDDAPIEGGIVKNGRTKLPEIGAIAQQGFTPTDEASVMEKVMGFVDVPNSDGTTSRIPWWKANHFQSPDAAKRSVMVNSTTPTPGPATAPAAAPRAAVRPGSAPAAVSTTPAVTQGTTQSPVAARQQALDQEAVSHVREAGDAAPQNRNINQHLLQLSNETATGPLTQTVQKLAGAVGLPSGSKYQEIDSYLNRQAAMAASTMGVPHTNAGLAASQTATGTTEYTPQALQEKVKYADALNSGAMAYREGLDKVVGTGGTPNLQKYQQFRAAWAKNFDPDIYRVEDAQRRGDTSELNAIRTRLGSRGMKVLAQKSANLRALENGSIPP